MRTRKIEVIWPNEIRELAGNEPHPDYHGWKSFLNGHCELRGRSRGVYYFGATNCNYILFPDGTLIQNFGFHGQALMKDIDRRGRVAVLNKIKANHAEYRKTMEQLGIITPEFKTGEKVKIIGGHRYGNWGHIVRKKKGDWYEVQMLPGSVHRDNPPNGRVHLKVNDLKRVG